ncbi:MAG: general secretion pathway protein GspK [Verrucomicrobiales bacterium]
MIFIPRADLRARESGAALIAVLFVIAVLTLVLATTAMLVRSDAELATTQKKAFRATQVAEMGIAIAANPVVKKTDLQLLNQTLPDGDSFSVRIKGEGGKFNINTLIQAAKTDPASEGRNFLEVVLAAMGIIDNDQRGLIVDNLVNWTDEDDIPEGDKDTYEKERYEAEGFFNYPFNRPFYNLSEVLLVRGMEVLPGVCPRWRDYFTIYSAGKLDVNEANAELLAVASLPDVRAAQTFYEQQFEAAEDGRDPSHRIEEAGEVIEMRWGADGMEDTDDDEKLDVATVATSLGLETELANARLTNQDTTTRIECTATVGDFRKRIVLVLRNRSNNPQILVREEVPLFDRPPPTDTPLHSY